VWTFLLALCAAPAGASDETQQETGRQTLYAAGSQKSFAGPAALFTGQVQVDMLFPENDNAPYSGAYVTFQPEARTAWHLHPAGQHMVVTAGTALTGTRDGKLIRFKAGETVWCPPGIDHWHGATPDAAMTHLVITGRLDGQNVIWKEQVSDTEYGAGQSAPTGAKASLHALRARHRAIVPIAAFTATGELEHLRSAIRRGLDVGLTINEIKEIQIHLYAYAGFPRALNGLMVLMDVLEQRKAAGITDPLGDPPKPFPQADRSLEIGKAVQTQLSGGPVTGPLFDFAPGVNLLLQRHLFGDLFARGVLDHQDRELATIGALANLEGVEAQLKAHIRIATNAGLTAEQLAALAEVLRRNVADTPARRTEAAIEAVLPERPTPSPGD
jgi:quercetin dioxygenase-like cupin family protein